MGQFAGLLYKNWLIQSKNKCGIICQLLTPMICLLIIYGLQVLVDNLDVTKDTKLSESFFLKNEFSLQHPSKYTPEFQMNHLLKGYQPPMGRDFVSALNGFYSKLDKAEIKFDGERDIKNEDILKGQIQPGTEKDFKVVQAHKVVDENKIPFNMIVPINLPIDYKTMKKIFKDTFLIRTCYKMFKYGVSDDTGDTKQYLKEKLSFDDDSNMRKTDCQIKKDDVLQDKVRVPNVRFQDNTRKSEDINERVKEEIVKMEKYDLFKIDKELEPSDGIFLFDEATDNTIKGTLSANNIQFFAYHHDNFVNMAVTTQFVRVYMNTETYITMLDMISNSILMKNFKNQSSLDLEQHEAYRTAMADGLKNTLSSLTLEDILNYKSKTAEKDTPNSDEDAKEKEKQEETGQKGKAKVGKLRQILSLIFSFPDRDYNKIILTNMFELLNVIFYPFAIGLALPVILNALAVEKEEKIQSLLKINGMKMTKYYLANFLFWFIYLAIIVIIFFVGGLLILKDGFFSKNSFVEIFFFCIGWNTLQIVFSFFILTMLNSAGAASAVGYIFSTIGTLFAINVITFVYPFPASMPYLFNLIPQFNYLRLLYYFLVKGSSVVQDYETREFHICMIFLYVNIVLYSFLTFLFSEGFLINLIRRKWRSLSKKEPKQHLKESRKLSQSGIEELLSSKICEKHPSEEEFIQEDKNESKFRLSCFDVNTDNLMHISAVREKVIIDNLVKSDDLKKQNELKEYAVCVKDLVKKYDNGKVALCSLSLMISKDQIYGLLGPNGAGKTTMISIVTNFLKQTSGDVFIFGDNKDDTKITSKLAFCPQFNIQWPNLTVKEHLKIFGMMRNMSGKDLEDSVNRIIDQVDLREKKNVQAVKLSGGMRRRLSIGIALMGETEIIFLDEPTTGLDPKRRRELWRIIKSIKKNKTFIISTHLMEEAEFLCDKIGIINKGNLRATGTANYLKKQFVDYFQAELTLKEDLGFWSNTQKETVCQALKGQVFYEFNYLIKVRIMKKDFDSYLNIFDAIESCKDFVKSWSLKSGSLEDAFTVIEKTYVK